MVEKSRWERFLESFERFMGLYIFAGMVIALIVSVVISVISFSTEDSRKEKQLERLNLRNPITAEKLLKINSNSLFDKNIKNIDFIIDNNDSTDILLVDIKYIFSKLINYLN